MTSTAETKRIFNQLSQGTDLAALALLSAMNEDDGLEVQKEDRHLLAELERFGCVSDGRITQLGRRVALVFGAKVRD